MPASARTLAQWREIGQVLRYWRRRAGLTQAQLGARLGYHHSQISRLENGSREPPADVLGRADALLGTGGELTRMAASLRWGQAGTAGVVVVSHHDVPDPAGPLAVRGWPSTLPIRGMSCPLHGYVECAVPGPNDLRRVVLGDEMDLADPDVVHLLAAWYVVLTRQTEEGAGEAQRALVDHVARRAAAWADERGARVVLRLAAYYAQFAGRLRLLSGQTGTGMVWLDQGLRWAEASGNRLARTTVLCDMGLIARFEHDLPAAEACADALAEGGERWAVAMAEVHRGLGHGQRGDAAACERHMDRARAAIARFDLRERLEAPWLTGDEGQMRVESAMATALRDIAAITGDVVTARRAVARTRAAIDHLPGRMRPTYLQFTVRLADSYACAGQLDAALATVDPILPQIPATPPITVRRELRSLHARLTQRWGSHRQVRDLDERLRLCC